MQENSKNDRVYRAINLSKKQHNQLRIKAHHNQASIYDLINEAISNIIQERWPLNAIKRTSASTNIQTYAIKKTIMADSNKFCIKHKISSKQLILSAILQVDASINT